MSTPPIGSLVAPAPEYRASMGTGEGAALLLATRRGSAHLYYPGRDRSCWVPLRQVGAIPPEAVPEASLERFLFDLFQFFEVDECAVEESAEGRLRLAIEIPDLSRDGLRNLEALLGDRLADFSVEARSMHAIKINLDLVSLPDAADAGR